MNKVKFTYDLDTVDGQMAAMRAMKSQSMVNVLFEITHNMYKKLTGGDVSEEFANGVQTTLDLIREEMDDEGLVINDLIQ